MIKTLNATLKLLGMTACLAVATAAGLSAAGTQPVEQEAPAKTPEEEAVEHYNRGLQFAKKAEGFAEKAMMAEGADREKLAKKAAKQWAASAREHDTAVKKNPKMHEAHSGLGYALRKAGQYDESLAAYNRALALEPRFGEAIEYRAETYLALGKLGEAREAYLALFAGDRKLADQLMVAMKEWIKAREADPQGVSAEALSEMADWLRQREQVATQTSELTLEGSSRSW